MNSRLLYGLIASLMVSNLSWAEMSDSINRIKPSIAIVGTYKNTNSPRFLLKGTGFVVSNKNLDRDNIVVTNAHVLENYAEQDFDAAIVVQVRSPQNELQMRSVKILEIDKIHDLALLQFEGAPISALHLGNSKNVREGQSIGFIGFPIGGALGFSPVTHRGMISSIAPAALPTSTAQQLNEKTILSLRSGRSFDIFQFDGTAYPGNSGGPLFDPATGNVLGVVNMVFIKGTRESALTHPSGISFAVPSQFIEQLLNRTKSN